MHVCFGIVDVLHVRWTKFSFLVEPFGYGDSYLQFLFRHFKVFRLRAIVHDAAGAVGAHSGKGTGYCYIIGRGSNSCLLRPVTGLLFCLYVKHLLPSIFKSVDVWSSMSCVLPDIELADKNVIKELGVFLMGVLRDTHNGLQKVQTHKASSLVNEKFACNCVEQSTFGLQWASYILPRDVNGEYFAEGTEKSKILANLMDKDKLWIIMAVPKFKISLTTKCEFVWVTHSDQKSHFTV